MQRFVRDPLEGLNPGPGFRRHHTQLPLLVSGNAMEMGATNHFELSQNQWFQYNMSYMPVSLLNALWPPGQIFADAIAYVVKEWTLSFDLSIHNITQKLWTNSGESLHDFWGRKSNKGFEGIGRHSCWFSTYFLHFYPENAFSVAGDF